MDDPSDVVMVEDDHDLDESSAFMKTWLDKMQNLLSGLPGPTAYLEKALTNCKQEFVDWLWNSFPEKDDVLYQHSSPIPDVTEEMMGQNPPTALHLVSLGFCDASSLKPQPGRDHTLQLIGMYLKDGFITTSDQLLCCQPPALQSANSSMQVPWGKAPDTLPLFSVGWIKGRARVCSLMALLCAMFEAERSEGISLIEELKKHCYKFWDSVRVAWVYHLKQPTKEDEALVNLKLSLRGSLRKAANVVQMAAMIRKLLAEGQTDFNSFLRRWNQQTVAAHQIRGRKLMSLRLLFEQTPKDRVGNN